MLVNNPSCRVWSRFERKRKDGGVVKLRIQDAPSSVLGNVVDFIIRYFLTGEAFQNAAGIISNPEAVAEYRDIVEMMIRSWIILICCHDNESEEVGEILGVSAVDLVKDENIEDLQLQTRENQKLFHIIEECEKLSKSVMNPSHAHHSGRGITVHPDYRGLGIASEFVKIRRLMIKEQNIPFSCAWMTSSCSQKAAEKDNWETLYEIDPNELGQRCDVVFKDPPIKFKLMLVRNSNCSK